MSSLILASIASCHPFFSSAGRLEVITPKEYVGSIMELAQQRRGEYVDMQYLTETRTTLVYNMPLAEVGGCSLIGMG